MKAKPYQTIARLFGGVLTAFWLFMGLVYVITKSREPNNWESTVITILIISLTAGFVVAWKKEKAGAIILIISGLAMSVFAGFAADHNHLYAILISGLPFIITGFLFYLAWQKSINLKT